MKNRELFDRTVRAISEAERLGFTNTRDALVEIALMLEGPRLITLTDAGLDLIEPGYATSTHGNG